MKDIVIYCPGEVHSDVLRYSEKLKRNTVIPKVLLIVSECAIGTIKIQCNDPRCKRYYGDKYNGWYEIKVNGLGGHTIKRILKKIFDFEKVPIAIMDTE